MAGTWTTSGADNASGIRPRGLHAQRTERAGSSVRGCPAPMRHDCYRPPAPGRRAGRPEADVRLRAPHGAGRVVRVWTVEPHAPAVPEWFPPFSSCGSHPAVDSTTISAHRSGTGTAHRWRALEHLEDPGPNRGDVVVLCCPEDSGWPGTGQPVRGPDRLGQGPQTAMPWSPRATSIASISSVSLGRLPSGITRCGPSRSAQPTD